jgi:hypothetical protein
MFLSGVVIMATVEILILEGEDAYRAEYERLYVADKQFSLRGVPVLFDAKSFDHIFSELSSGGGRNFSERRARRLKFMQAILEEMAPIEIMLEPQGSPGRDAVAVFCRDLESVMYLRVRVGSEGLQVVTFFDFGRDHSKRYNQHKKKCVPLTDAQLKQMISPSESC